jgi:AcrR family transcriptional regulator
MSIAVASNHSTPHHQPKSDLRARIVDAAWTIGNEHTPEGLTIRSIATRAGVSPALLYTYFTGKAALLREMQRLAEPRLESALAQAVEGAGTPQEGLFRVCVAYVEFARQHRWLCEPAGKEPAVQSPTSNLTQAFVARVVALLDARGCQDMTAEQTALQLRIAINGLIATESLGSDSDRADGHEFVEGYIRMLLRGL